MELTIRPETTRWRPQRSTTGVVEVHFEGPRGLTPATTLQITGPDGPLSGMNLAFEVVNGQSDPARYKITWSGPWTSGTPPPFLPRGDYRIQVRGVLPDETIVTSSPNDANGTVSLVEVTGVELLAALDDPRGAGALSANPGVATIANQNPAQDRPAVGKRIFAEALSNGGPVLNKVRVRATVGPWIADYRGQAPVTVYFRSLDVDDPARRDPRTGALNPADRDLDNSPLVVIDNRGTPVDGIVAPREVSLAAGQIIAETQAHERRFSLATTTG